MGGSRVEGMEKIFTLDFTEIGSVKSAIPLSGRGIKLICRNLVGQYCYSVTSRAADILRAKYSSVYINNNNEAVS